MEQQTMQDDEPTDDRCNDLRITVSPNGMIIVHNTDGDDHGTHSVMLDDDGNVVRCSCKGHKFNDNCYHETAVENSPLVVSSAQAASATHSAEAMTDGGDIIEVGERTVRTDLGGETDNDDEDEQETDHWGHEVRHFDDGAVGAGEASQCQSCGSRQVAMVAATADSSHKNWEEFYECQQCDVTGSFRFYGKANRREWTGHIDYPNDNPLL